MPAERAGEAVLVGDGLRPRDARADPRDVAVQPLVHSPDLRKNADGSVDIYFGPKAPAGKESNWVPTSAGGQFEVLFRLYGPEKPFFDKTWRLPDIEECRDSEETQRRERLWPPNCARGLPLAGWLQPAFRRSAQAAKTRRQRRPVTADNFIRAETRPVLRAAVVKRGLRQVPPLPRAHADRQPDRDPRQPRHAVLGGRVRPRCGAGDDHAAGRGQALHVDDRDRRGSIRAGTVVYGAGTLHLHARRRSARATSWRRSARWSIRRTRRTSSRSTRLQDAIKIEQPGGPGKFEVPNWDPASQKKVRDALMVLGETLPD